MTYSLINPSHSTALNTSTVEQAPDCKTVYPCGKTFLKNLLIFKL